MADYKTLTPAQLAQQLFELGFRVTIWDFDADAEFALNFYQAEIEITRNNAVPESHKFDVWWLDAAKIVEGNMTLRELFENKNSRFFGRDLDPWINDHNNKPRAHKFPISRQLMELIGEYPDRNLALFELSELSKE